MLVGLKGLIPKGLSSLEELQKCEKQKRRKLKDKRIKIMTSLFKNLTPDISNRCSFMTGSTCNNTVHLVLFFRGQVSRHTLMLFCPYWTKGKLAQLSFYEKRPILILMAKIRPLEIILWPKKQLNSFSFFMKRTIKLVFLWSNMGKKSIKVLRCV